MARVVAWLPQFAAAGLTRAGWPGSNGSVTGTNATAADDPPVAAALVARLAVSSTLAVALVLAAAPVLDDALEPLQPATRPIAVAQPAASVSVP
jgi:hypothetical protein